MISKFLKALLPAANLLLVVVIAAPVQAANKTPLVTGNGFGFAVYSEDKHCLNGFYAHPYKFERSIKEKPLDEGVETANLIDRAEWQPIDAYGRRDSGDDRKLSNPPHPHYVEQSQVIEIDGESTTEKIYMPFGLDENVLILQNQSNHSNQASSASKPDQQLIISWKYPVQAVSKLAEGAFAITFKDRQETAVALPIAEHDSALSYNDSTFKGCDAWAVICLDNAEKLNEALAHFKSWRSGLDAEKLLARELSEIERWRVKPRVTFHSDNERKLWRQSEMMLRMAQSREPNRDDHGGRYNHGMIVASLPDGAWWVPWVRDMVYATMALVQMGHYSEAESALLAFLDARPVGKMEKEVGGPYQVSVVRYFGDGEEEPFFTMEGATNIELDNWGLVLWALGEYCKARGDRGLLYKRTYRGTVYENARDYVVIPLLGKLHPRGEGLIVRKDTSIWEEKQKDEKHFAYSTAAAIKGLDAFLPFTHKEGQKSLFIELLKKTRLLQLGFFDAFVADGKLRGALEEGVKNEVDGAMLSAINMGIVTEKPTIDGTIKAMSALKMPSGGYRRVRSIVEDPKIFEYWYERQEFLFIDFSMASVYLRNGRADLANSLIDPVVDKAARDNFILPEMYVSEINDRFTGAIGEPTGATPMVGYGAGAFISYLLDRQQFESRQMMRGAAKCQ